MAETKEIRLTDLNSVSRNHGPAGNRTRNSSRKADFKSAAYACFATGPGEKVRVSRLLIFGACRRFVKLNLASEPMIQQIVSFHHCEILDNELAL